MSCPLLAQINLTNLKNNAKAVKDLIGKKVKLCAVVKSNAYGHGLVETSSALYPLVDSYCVSMEREALDLRISGNNKEIILLTPALSGVERLISKDITLTVSTKSEIIAVSKACEKLNKKATVHIKLNTGMNRLGASNIFEVSEIIGVAKSSGITVGGALSHLGDTTNKKYVNNQYESFLRLSEPIVNYDDRVNLHLSSSGGALLHKKYHFSMVRVGIMLYGYTPFITDEIKLSPVMKVYAKNLGVKSLKNQRFLYGSKRYNEKAVTLIRMGYADGFSRDYYDLSPMCMDLSAVKGACLDEYVPVMTNALELSKKYKTIPYEILCSITKRAQFEYLE